MDFYGAQREQDIPYNNDCSDVPHQVPRSESSGNDSSNQEHRHSYEKDEFRFVVLPCKVMKLKREERHFGNQEPAREPL